MNTLATQSHSRDSLSDLVHRVDLVALVERYAGQGRRTGHMVLFSCPNPAHPDTHPSFSVSTGKDGLSRWKCFSQCNAHGDALDLVKWLTGATTAEAARTLREFLGDRTEHTPRPRATTRRAKAFRALPQHNTTLNSSPQAEALLEKYLASRAWPREVVEEFGLCVVTDSHGAPRIRHPYFTPNKERVLWWQDRGTKQSKTKWLSPSGSSSTLYNLPSLTNNKLEVVFLCEGPADTITAANALRGVHRVAVVGIPGASAWKHEYRVLFDSVRVVIATDNDKAGEQLARTLAEEIECTTRLDLEPGTDLTDTALTFGVEFVRDLLLDAAQLNTTETSEIALLLSVFPNGQIVKEGAA